MRSLPFERATRKTRALMRSEDSPRRPTLKAVFLRVGAVVPGAASGPDSCAASFAGRVGDKIQLPRIDRARLRPSNAAVTCCTKDSVSAGHVKQLSESSQVPFAGSFGVAGCIKRRCTAA